VGSVGRREFVFAVGLLSATFWFNGCGLSGASPFASQGPDRDSSGQVVAAGEVKALDIQLADCFRKPAAPAGSNASAVPAAPSTESDAVEAVMVVPCVEPHDFEVFYSFNLTDGPYPGVESIEEQWVDGCLAQFEDFVGASFDDSILDISAIYPTEQTWNDMDDREVLCSVTAVDGSLRTGSARNSGL
jgi:hypothetical protein